MDLMLMHTSMLCAMQMNSKYNLTQLYACSRVAMLHSTTLHSYVSMSSCPTLEPTTSHVKFQVRLIKYFVI
jgi:hypothetical protein